MTIEAPSLGAPPGKLESQPGGTPLYDQLEQQYRKATIEAAQNLTNVEVPPPAPPVVEAPTPEPLRAHLDYVKRQIDEAIAQGKGYIGMRDFTQHLQDEVRFKRMTVPEMNVLIEYAKTASADKVLSHAPPTGGRRGAQSAPNTSHHILFS